MSVKDMIKKSVLESGAFTNYDVPGILTALAAALLLGALIYLVYRKFYAGVVFSRTFAVTLVGMTVLTCMVTLAISTNVVISLGMVGALSIVRFRTAIKDPMDLLYLFWAITTGITAGAGMYVLALLAAAIMILMIVLFYHKQLFLIVNFLEYSLICRPCTETAYFQNSYPLFISSPIHQNDRSNCT